MKNFLPAHVRIWRGFLRKKKTRLLAADESLNHSPLLFVPVKILLYHFT